MTPRHVHHRISRTLIAAAVAVFAIAMWIPTAGATNPQPVTPTVDRVCKNGTTLTTTWGYNNPNATTTTGINNPIDDNDADDNFFSPAPASRGQTTSFLTGPNRLVFTTISDTSNGPLSWNLGVPSNPPAVASAPKDCADVSVTGALTSDPNPHQALFNPSTVSLGNTYSVVVTSSPDSSPAADVVLTDTVSAGLTPGAAPTGCTLAASTYTCNVGTLAPGVPVTFTFSVTNPASATPAVTNTATVASTTFDPNTANNTSTENTQIVASGGTTSAGIISAGQSLSVNANGNSGTVQLQTGTAPLSLDLLTPQVLNIVPTGAASQIITGKFDTGKPQPFVLLPFIKFYVQQSNAPEKRLPLCPRYLVPKPPADGSVCEYFRSVTLQGHVILWFAMGATDPRLRR